MSVLLVAPESTGGKAPMRSPRELAAAARREVVVRSSARRTERVLGRAARTGGRILLGPFLGEELVYRFDLLPEGGHKMPAFINLQQYYVEEFLVARASELANRIELRWKNKVTGILARARVSRTGRATEPGLS